MEQTTEQLQPQPENIQPAEQQVEPTSEAPKETPVAAEQPTEQPKEQPASDDDAAKRKEYADKIASYYLEHGDLKPFLEAFSTDYSTLSPEEVLRIDLKKQYPQLSSERLDRLFTKQVLEKFMQIEGVFEEEDVALGSELMKAEADKVRARLISEQQSYLQPVTRVEDKSKEQEEIKNKWSSYVTESQFVKDLSESKRVAIKIGDDELSVSVNPEELVAQTIQDEKFFSKFFDEKGQLDWQKWAKVVAYANDMEGYEQTLVNHGKAVGSKSVIEGDLKNSSFKILGRPAQRTEQENVQSKIAEAISKALSK